MFKRQPRYKKGVEDVKQLNSDVNYNMEELIANSNIVKSNEPDIENRHEKYNVVSFDTRTVKFYDGNKAYNVELSIANLEDGKKIAYAKKFFGYDEALTKKIQTTETRGLTNTPLNQQSVDSSVSQSDKKSTKKSQQDNKIQYSVTDNKGRTLTKEQQEKFKDSVVRDKDGNLLTMYHGTPNGDYTVFRDGTYFTSNKEYADVYQNQFDDTPNLEARQTKCGRTVVLHQRVQSLFALTIETC